ncbi:MAG: hypothetical protein K2M64_01740 [Clostridia bacterium]|nr:hypothetical protein [Clostridia bacterium]
MNLFGTDGIRGTYGSTLTDSTAFLLGKSLAFLGDCPIVVIGRDTRKSGDSLFSALTHGVYAGGGNVINLGVLPTNAVGHFVRKMGGDYGVMITASHNPPCDNGLKVFDRYGVKMCQSKQSVVSKMMESLKEEKLSNSKIYEPVFYDIENIYCEDVLRALKVNLSGLNVALDCCYGSAYKVAPSVFVKAGANVASFCNSKNGDKINVDCGATHTEFLLDRIQNGKYHLSFAFDGDADRLAVFEGTQFVPNNKVFYAIARYLKEKGALLNNAVCGTLLTNGGLEQSLNKLGVDLIRTDVGDTNVFQGMVKHGLNFGGEESGHYLLCDYATTSDAIINALFVCKIYAEKGSILKYSANCVDKPSQTANIAITATNARQANEDNLALASSRITALYPDCRIVLRKSGTEPKIRAYVEGAEAEEAIKQVVATFAEQNPLKR